MLKEHIAKVGLWVFSIELVYSYKSRLPLITEIFFMLPLLDHNTKSWKN